MNNYSYKVIDNKKYVSEKDYLILQKQNTQLFADKEDARRVANELQGEVERLSADYGALLTYGRHLCTSIANHPIANPHGYRSVDNWDAYTKDQADNHASKIKADAVRAFAATINNDPYTNGLKRKDIAMDYADKLERGDDV